MALDLLPTAVLCDAAPEPIALLPRIRRLWKGATLAGPALTVRTPPGEHLSLCRALEQELPEIAAESGRSSPPRA